MKLIQSLCEALAWFEREINWGVPAMELHHLCGRIGELYADLSSQRQWKSSQYTLLIKSVLELSAADARSIAQSDGPFG